jgi:predicted transposase YbfD/YdcC
LTIIAVICGAESWDSIELFGKTKINFLKTFLKLPNGIPSHDTINRVFSMLNPRTFERLFFQWAASLKDKGIDTMGTQTKIAEDIVKGGADYILALKGNQQNIKEETESIFRVQQPDSVNEITEKGHGRIETRKCEVISNLEFLYGKEKWKNLSGIIKISTERCIRDKTEKETRYYISSLKTTAKNFNEHIRMHWGVENKLHWTLDMTFNEDRQRKRNKMAAQNFSLVNKIALNILKKDKSKGSIKSKRLKAGWDNNFLLKLITN